MPDDTEERLVLTLPDRIRRLADDRGAQPASVQRPDGDVDLRIEQEPDDVDADRMTWNEFFERFDPTEQAVYYHSSAGRDTLDVIDRRPRDTAKTGDEPTEDPGDVETEPIATGDTGDAEPVAFERTEDRRADRADADDASTAPASDAERAPSSVAEGLVLDEIRESQAGLGSSETSEEFLVFENTGEAAIDLSGWTVESGDGRTYRFLPGTVLEPGGRVTLHSEDGEDTDDHLYWGADEPVWGSKDISVSVRTETGKRVLWERYET